MAGTEVSSAKIEVHDFLKKIDINKSAKITRCLRNLMLPRN